MKMKLNAILLFSLIGLGLATPVTMDGDEKVLAARSNSTSLPPCHFTSTTPLTADPTTDTSFDNDGSLANPMSAAMSTVTVLSTSAA
jgi:hypothetical protein